MDTKIKVGIEALDAVTGGFKKGQLIIIGGRPAMGKSVLSLHMMHVMAKRQSLGSIMFTYEYIHQPKVLNSLYCINQKEKELIKFVDLMELGTDGIIKECKKAKGTYEVVIIDYLQLLQEKNMSGAEWMYNALKKFKNMATELNCVVIVISQLMRTVENREDHHPVMSDMPSLGPFGKVEDYSDGVFFLYRDNYYNKVKQQGGGLGKTDLILAKYENLEPRNIELPFFMDFFKTPPDVNIEAESVYLRIKRLRTDKRMTQQELADRINVSSKTVSKWESGRGLPEVSILIPLSRALDVTVDYILDCKL